MKYLLLILLAAIPIAWGAGTGDTGFRQLWQLLSGTELSFAEKTILLDLRLPRVLGALLVGGMLSASGCAAQNLFRNDLASPHVLGCVNAAALGAVAALLCGGAALSMSCAALGMTLLTLFILLIPGWRSRWEGGSIILAGIAVNACCAALSSGALYLADERLNSVVFWLLGGFWRMGWQEIFLLLPAAVCGWILLYRMAPEMDMLLRCMMPLSWALSARWESPELTDLIDDYLSVYNENEAAVIYETLIFLLNLFPEYRKELPQSGDVREYWRKLAHERESLRPEDDNAKAQMLTILLKKKSEINRS